MISHAIETLLARVAEAEEAEHGHEPGARLSIHKLVSTAASFYEKLRYLIDYREEHTVRRAAIDRIMSRKLFIERGEVNASRLLTELVESKYIDESEVSEHLIHGVSETLEKFIALIDTVSEHGHRKMLVGLTASEIESKLSSREYAIDIACADAFYETVRKGAEGKYLTTEDLELQLYCASYRALLRSDNETLSYALWRHATASKADAISNDLEHDTLVHTLASIKYAVEDETQWDLVRKLKTKTICFQIIRQMVLEKGSGAEAIIRNPKKLEKFVTEYVENILVKENERISNAGLRAVLFLLITKFTLVFVIELPYELWLGGDINYLPLAINLLVHPTLLYLLTRRVKVPGEENTHAIVEAVEHIVHGTEEAHLQVQPYRGYAFIFWSLYTLITLGVFGAILAFLQYLDFTWVGGVLFVFFFALVMYFAFRIRYRASQWRIIKDDSLSNIMAQVMLNPVIQFGRYLSHTFSTVNVFIMFMDFLIETPFRFVLNFSQMFIRYLSDKTNEVY